MGPLKSHHDVVVVGARCAGAATAMLLARAGHDVVMVDRAQLPADRTSTHALARGGVVQLARWGLLEELLETGAPPIQQVSFHHVGSVTRRTVRHSAGVDLLLAPRRYVLDDVLVRAAVHAGGELLTGVTVTGALRDAIGRVTGVAARDAEGRQLELTARLVVGADGVHSRMAGLLGAEAVARYAPGGGCFYTYVGDVPWNGFEFHLSETAFAGVFPTHDDQACVWLIRPTELLAPVLGAGVRRAGAWLDALGATVPELAERVRSGSVTAPVRGAVDLPNQLRRAAGPGWALVGDAGYHRDPITGHGITDAFRDAELLAEAADRLLQDREPEPRALADYEAERNSAITDVFALTRTLGGFPEPETFLDLQARLSKALEREAQALATRPVPVGIAVTTAA
jgi:2-polyprenyl-6-methoxyphenol hydroxylase-like FAD-dependent oxidoreductase